MTAPSRSITLASERRSAGSNSRFTPTGIFTFGGIHPHPMPLTNSVVPSSRSPTAHGRPGAWRATASTRRCSLCCSAARPDTSPATAPAAADNAEAPAGAAGLVPACPAAARWTVDINGLPAAGDVDGDGATGAPDTGAVGADTDGAATTGGRRSEP
ncbi:hypothetical protein BST25_18090 [Mycobacterium heidelbergense]|uniref:Uncharacterized protein n=1 Tax=Mycobacterium heidelbergense TaxID=53376 RepID=A0A1X0DES7_MYCHE|nr:hypothetical protein BST25_18090 [Mycobacterium heidelbergense]